MALWTGVKEIKEIEESWYFPLPFFVFLKVYAGGLIVQTRVCVCVCVVFTRVTPLFPGDSVCTCPAGGLGPPSSVPHGAAGRLWTKTRVGIKQVMHASLQIVIERVLFQLF